MNINWETISIKELAAIISKHLTEQDIDAVLVGGACVSIYTENKYTSYDLDFVSYTSIKDIASALSELGFRKESSRHFIHKGCPYFIEFVAPPLAIGSESVKKKATLQTKVGDIILLTPTDSVKDRLAAFYHWNDQQALEQAVMLTQSQKVNMSEIQRWSEQEGQAKKHKKFILAVKKK